MDRRELDWRSRNFHFIVGQRVLNNGFKCFKSWPHLSNFDVPPKRGRIYIYILT